MFRTATTAAAVGLALTAAPLSAQTVLRATAAPAPAKTPATAWDASPRGKQLVVPVDITFDDRADYQAFARNTLPVTINLTNAVSGRSMRYPIRTPMRVVDATAITVFILVGSVEAPIWDADGCIQTSATADRADGGLLVKLTLAPCMGVTAARTAGQPIGGIVVKGGKNPGGSLAFVAGQPIGGIVVKGGKNPGGSMRIVPRPAYLGDDAKARLVGQAGIVVEITNGEGRAASVF